MRRIKPWSVSSLVNLSRHLATNLILRITLPRPWRCVLHVLIKPTDHLVEHVLDTLAARITMRLVWQHHEPNGRTIPLHRLVHALRLDRERPGVVVSLTVNHQHRLIDLRRKHEG